MISLVTRSLRQLIKILSTRLSTLFLKRILHFACQTTTLSSKWFPFQLVFLMRKPQNFRARLDDADSFSPIQEQTRSVPQISCFFKSSRGKMLILSQVVLPSLVLMSMSLSLLSIESTNTVELEELLFQTSFLSL